MHEPLDVLMVPRNPVDRTLLLMLLLGQPRSTHRLIQLCDARPAPTDAATWATTLQTSIVSKLMRSLLFSYVRLEVSTPCSCESLIQRMSQGTLPGGTSILWIRTPIHTDRFYS